METNVVDDFLAQHQAVTCLKRVLHALGVGGLGGQSQLADSAVGSDGAEELVTKGQSIRLPELQVEPRANIDARAGVGVRFIQERAVRVGRGDAGWVNGIDYAHVLRVAPEGADEIRGIFVDWAAYTALQVVRVVGRFRRLAGSDYES